MRDAMRQPSGQDVYEGVRKDYRGKDVTPRNFLAVLRGDAHAMKGIGSGTPTHTRCGASADCLCK